MKYYNVRYSITLNDQQLDYLSDADQDINRMMCFKTLVRLASMEQTTVNMKNFSAGISIGQFAVSKVELARLWNCDRKTATRIIKEFNDMDIITSVANNRTTVHTLNCLSVWFTSNGCIKNPHFKINPFVKPIEKKVKQVKKTIHVPAAKGKKQTVGEVEESQTDYSSSLISSQEISANEDKEDNPIPATRIENDVTESNTDSASFPDGAPEVTASTEHQEGTVTEGKVNLPHADKKVVKAKSQRLIKHHPDKSRRKRKKGRKR